MELSKRPVIVVAKWKGAPFTNESVVEGNVLKQYQVRTKIVVERVISGDLKPGEHSILVGFRIGWSKESPLVTSYMSTEMLGDAHAPDSNLWFFKTKRSLDSEDPDDYLFLDTYRGVQPLCLEPYFEALRAKDPNRTVPTLLGSENSEVVIRSLRFICGDDHPNETGTYLVSRGDSKRARKPMLGQADSVKKLIKSDKDEIRRMATWAYSDLVGKESIGEVRGLLDEADHFVRAVAIAVLIKHGQWDSIEAIQTAAKDVEGSPGSQLVELFASIEDDRIVPAMISMLQTNSPVDEQWRIPGIDAQLALKKRTGYLFPFDVKAGLKAWQEIQAFSNPDGNAVKTKSLMETFRAPLVASLVGDSSAPQIRVTNTSKRKVTISRQPDNVSIRTPSSLVSGSFLLPDDKVGGVTLDPGQSILTRIELDADFYIHDQKGRSIELTYKTNGRELNRQNWAGRLAVELDSSWTEPSSEIKETVLRWPNGNLKVTGKTTNGIKTGEWTYYNEQGDRIRVENGGSVTSSNPNHPSNKGLGRKK